MSIASSRRKTLQISANSSATPRRSLTEAPKKVLRFQMPRLIELFDNFGENRREYEQLICSIRDNYLRDDELLSLLIEANACISILNRDFRLFVEAILSLKWVNKNEKICKEYKSFIVNLLSAHNYHSKFAIDKLISNFLPDDDIEWINGIPSDEECIKFGYIHSVLNILFKIIPMSREIVHQSLISQFPYIKKSTHAHEVYIYNILCILDYQPEFRLDLLNLIFNRLIILDSNAPREAILHAETSNEEIFELEDIEKVEKNKHYLANTLDVCLDKIFTYFLMECYDLNSGELIWEKTKNLYQNLIEIFDKIILPTYNIHHVQFSIFFFCSFKITISEGFLNYLWKKTCDLSVPSIYRQTAISYIASFLARANFVPLSMLKSTLELISKWIHKYISNQDGLECLNSDVRLHSVFYSVCQSLFYIIAFRHRDLVNSRKNIAFLGTLNLAKMVTCRLNPLKVCQPAILQNFAAVTRTYQLAYCYSIIEKNQRNTIPTVYFDEKGSQVVKSTVLDSFFPFDPFLLKRCSSKISPIYLEYQTTEPETMETENKMEEDDDFLNESLNKSNLFSYGTSPGFKYKT